MKTETFLENFAHLADAPNGIEKLHELILQLAVQGKLVPQDPSDKPADVLLERIHVELAEMEKGRTGKKRKPALPPLESGEYAIPENWAWVELHSIADIGTGTTPAKTKHE